MTGNSNLETILTAAPVVPVLIIDDVQSAVPLATALVKGGLPAIEITLRTDAAIEAIAAVAAAVEGAFVGAGTVMNGGQLDAVTRAGATFAVSPGATDALLDAADNSAVPLLPGAANASQAMALVERGYDIMKFFPAGPAGGVNYLKALSSPLAGIRFCPTGGVSATNAPDYLALSNVICVGGSWVAPTQAIRDGDWARITDLARQAVLLGDRS